MKLTKLGEFGLIELISKWGPKRPDTVVGIGDDAAVLKGQGSRGKGQEKYLLITTDTLIENVHFKLTNNQQQTTNNIFYQLGYKAMIANISDIVAMGGYPTHALVTVGLRKSITLEQVKQLYNGIDKLAKKYHIDVIGGDTVASPKEVMISITMLGEVEAKNLLLRSTAKVGDLICVTGKFGGPAALNFNLQLTTYNLRLSEARFIARSKLATSMIDSSDGLVRSVLELCKASKTGARIFEDKVPIAKRATLDQALYGGEEYELVFTVPKNKTSKIPIKCGIAGEIVSKNRGVKLVDSYGKIKPLKSGGYEHFIK